jgi:hypothetical protein
MHTLSDLASNPAPSRRAPGRKEDDDDDPDASQEGESWFAGGERRYVNQVFFFTATLTPVFQRHIYSESRSF